MLSTALAGITAKTLAIAVDSDRLFLPEQSERIAAGDADDLAALAWIRHSKPHEYARVHGWLTKVRAKVSVPRSGHDTRAWVRLAGDGARFGRAAAPFDDVVGLWREGLLETE